MGTAGNNTGGAGTGSPGAAGGTTGTGGAGVVTGSTNMGGTSVTTGSTSTGGTTVTAGSLPTPLSQQQILDAQRALSANGFPVATDGIAGPSTQSAVRQFQAKHNLPQTGVLDPNTVNQLNAATQSTMPAAPKASESPSTF
jgi:peptidoglycan hydrolase-like protein with peptidoglycan-binding domain